MQSYLQNLAKHPINNQPEFKRDVNNSNQETQTFDSWKCHISLNFLLGLLIFLFVLQSATSQSKHAARFLRLAMASIMDILKIKPFVEVTVGQLLWGYEDPLLKLAKDVVPKEQKLPYEEFGLMYNVSQKERAHLSVSNVLKIVTEKWYVERYSNDVHRCW